MRQAFLMLCLLVNLSVVLMPFNSMHAHVVPGGGAGAEVHDGHRHDAVHSHEGAAAHSHDDWLEQEFATEPANESADPHAQVIELDAAFTSQSTAAVAWDQWLPLACVIAVLALGMLSCPALLRPPKSDLRSSSHRGHWRPPLRGPPASIPAL